MTYRQLLRGNADFRRLWLGQVVSEIGDWLNNIAVLALTINLAGAGREGIAIAVYAIARHLPLFLFGPLAGVVVDRIDRRRVLIAADVIRALFALGFLFANRLSSLPAIYIVGASLFAVSAFFNAAKRATVPNLVRGAEELLSANSLSASTTAATIAIGSALGGILATFVGRNFVFVLNSATFLVSAELVSRMRIVPRRDENAYTLEVKRPITRSGEIRQGADVLSASHRAARSKRVKLSRRRGILGRLVLDFRDGLGYVRRTSVLMPIFVVAGGWGLGNGAARALYSLFGARLGIATAAGFLARPTDFGISVLFVAMGFGGVLGAPLAKRFNAGSTDALGKRMGRSLVFDGCGLALFSLMPSLWSAALVLILREMNFAIWWTAQQTIIMSRTDDRFAGRVFASYETLTTLMMVGSMLAAGVAADRFGIKPVAASGGIVIACSGLLWFVLRRRK